MKNFAPMPKPQVTGPKPPKGLSPGAKSWWKKIASGWELDEAGFLVLETALECFDRMRQAQKIVAKDGITATDRFGQAKVHPAVLVEGEAIAGLLRALRGMKMQIGPLNGAVRR